MLVQYMKLYSTVCTVCTDGIVQYKCTDWYMEYETGVGEDQYQCVHCITVYTVVRLDKQKEHPKFSTINVQ